MAQRVAILSSATINSGLSSFPVFLFSVTRSQPQRSPTTAASSTPSIVDVIRHRHFIPMQSLIHPAGFDAHIKSVALSKEQKEKVRGAHHRVVLVKKKKKRVKIQNTEGASLQQQQKQQQQQTLTTAKNR